MLDEGIGAAVLEGELSLKCIEDNGHCSTIPT